MAQIICLAVSRKHGHFCVAGIDVKHHAWIRPVSNRQDGAISQELMAFPNGKKPLLMDVLEIPLAGKQATGEFQPENWRLLGAPWRKIGRANIESLSKYAGLSRTILHNYMDRVLPIEITMLPKECRNSLQLIEATNVRFVHDPVKSQAWRATFTFFGRDYDLRVTDPAAEYVLDQGGQIPPRCYLTISLTEPWRGSSDMEAFCYKLVAGVIPREKSLFFNSLNGSIPSMSQVEFMSRILVSNSPMCAG